MVFRSACPRVCDTSVIGAPPSIAWEACACLSQWADVAGLITSALRRGLHDVVDAALRNREHAILRFAAPLSQGGRELGRQQAVAALANDR